jgi:hypothetical protein
MGSVPIFFKGWNLTEQELKGETGWSPIDARALVGETLKFVSGDQTGNRFRMNYFQDENKDLVARVWFGPVTEGPPQHAHGGSIAMECSAAELVLPKGAFTTIMPRSLAA